MSVSVLLNPFKIQLNSISSYSLIAFQRSSDVYTTICFDQCLFFNFFSFWFLRPPYLHLAVQAFFYHLLLSLKHLEVVLVDIQLPVFMFPWFRFKASIALSTETKVDELNNCSIVELSSRSSYYITVWIPSTVTVSNSTALPSLINKILSRSLLVDQ